MLKELIISRQQWDQSLKDFGLIGLDCSYLVAHPPKAFPCMFVLKQNLNSVLTGVYVYLDDFRPKANQVDHP